MKLSKGIIFFALVALLWPVTRVVYAVEGCNMSTQLRGTQKTYCLKFQKNSEIGPKGALLVVGEGQKPILGDNGSKILTSAEVVDISASNIQVKFHEEVKDFKIGKATKFCNGNKRVTWKQIKPGDGVTIKSGIDEEQAIFVYKGFLRFQLTTSGPLEIQGHDCK